MLTIELDEDHFHHDILSDDVQRVHPELPSLGSAQQRYAHQHECDVRAYNTIKQRFPGFTPPGGTISSPQTMNSHTATRSKPSRRRGWDHTDE